MKRRDIVRQLVFKTLLRISIPAIISATNLAIAMILIYLRGASIPHAGAIVLDTTPVSEWALIGLFAICGWLANQRQIDPLWYMVCALPLMIYGVLIGVTILNDSLTGLKGLLAVIAFFSTSALALSGLALTLQLNQVRQDIAIIKAKLNHAESKR